MATSFERQRVSEAMWDIPRLVSGRYGRGAAFAASAQLAPTALVPALWAIVDPGTPYGTYVFDIEFSTDTALQWTLSYLGATPGLAAVTPFNIGNNIQAPQTHAQAAVAALPAGMTTITSGFAGANTYTSILPKAWLNMLAGGTALVVSTSLIPANCICTFWWAEMAS